MRPKAYLLANEGEDKGLRDALNRELNVDVACRVELTGDVGEADAKLVRRHTLERRVDVGNLAPAVGAVAGLGFINRRDDFEVRRQRTGRDIGGSKVEEVTGRKRHRQGSCR